MHRGIISHDTYVEGGNLDQLDNMDFVFPCLDPGPEKKLVLERLVELDVPFVDTGIGIYETEGALGGILRVTTGTSEKNDHLISRISLSEGDEGNVYAQNIQVVELNALTAALAVIRWKKLCGFYVDFDHEHHCLYTISGNTLLNEDHGQ